MKAFLCSLLLAGLLGLSALEAAPKPNPRADNTPPAGFKALFNGKNLDGWQGMVTIQERAKLTPEALAAKQKEANKNYLPHWVVKEGVIFHDGKGGGNLQTSKDYGNFELYVDWKIEEKGDSGLYLRGNPQVQIWDSDKTPGATGKDKGSGSGGLWNNKKNPNRPLKKADKPVGQWNTFHIIMKGDKVTVW